MTVHWAFKHLGIEPTTAALEIRRAYARQLKAMDLDADVDGYSRLRSARDAALAYATGTYDERPFDEEALDQSPEVSEEQARPTSPTDGPVDESLASAPRPLDEIAVAQQRLIAILFPGGDQMYHLTPEETDELLRCFEFLKTDPRLEQINTLALAGDWFAQVIAQSLPRSDPLVRPAAAYFGWNREQEIGVHAALAAVVARANALDWRDRLRQRSHRLHRAWKELTKPANENSKRGWVSTKRIIELLREVRRRHPSLEGELDWYRVSLWETSRSGGWVSFVGWRLLVVAAVVGLNICSHLANHWPSITPARPDSPDAVFSPPLTDPQSDISRVLALMADGSVDAAQLQSKNPKLYSVLRLDWERWKNTQGHRDQFVSWERNLLTDLVHRGWARAPYGVLRDKMRADVQIARTLQAEDCANYLAGRLSFDRLNEDQQALRRRATGELLLAVDPDRPGPAPGQTHEYRVPGSIVEAASKDAALTPKQFTEALGLRIPPGVRASTACRARIVLREVILAEPERESLPIMRDMQD